MKPKKFIFFFTLAWTNLYGGLRGKASDRKACPEGAFIARMIIVVGHQYDNIYGVTRIGQAVCSNGMKLECCDGGPLRRGDRQFLFTTTEGWKTGRINYGDTVRGVCMNRRCAGTDGRRFLFQCVEPRRVSGFYTRSDHNIKALGFLCRG